MRFARACRSKRQGAGEMGHGEWIGRTERQAKKEENWKWQLQNVKGEGLWSREETAKM